MRKSWHLLTLTCMLIAVWSCGNTGDSQTNNYIDSRMAYLSVKLNLDQTQASKIKAVLIKETDETAKMRSADTKDFRSARRGIRERQEKTTAQVQEILNDIQKETYAELIEAGVNDNNFIELQSKLNLTVAQSDSIVKIFGGMRRNIRARRMGESGRSGNRENRMMDMRTAREETDSAIIKVLDDNQKRLYKKLQEERMEEMRRRFEGRRGSIWE